MTLPPYFDLSTTPYINFAIYCINNLINTRTHSIVILT